MVNTKFVLGVFLLLIGIAGMFFEQTRGLSPILVGFGIVTATKNA